VSPVTSAERVIDPAVTKRPGWGWPQYLALVGAAILLVEVYTVGGWLLDGPHQITKFREGYTRDWYAARVFESGMVILSIYVIVKVVRGCRQQRKLFTFDVLFCLTGFSMLWASSMVNFFTPMFTFSSNLVNLNDVCGHIPFVVNEDCGRVPNPVLFIGLFETFGLLGIAMLLGTLATRIRGRWPSVRNTQLFGFFLLGGMIIVLLEPLLIIPLHLWTYPGTPISIELGGTAWRYPLFPEILCFGFMLGIPAALRFFRDDRGQTFVERDLERYSPKVRTLVAGLALYTFAQIAVIGCATIPLWPLAFHQREWGTMPPALNNGLCDQPGVIEHTRYGPCPGSPGFKLPMPGTLPPDTP